LIGRHRRGFGPGNVTQLRDNKGKTMSKLTDFEREMIEHRLDLRHEDIQVQLFIDKYWALKRIAKVLYDRVQLLESALRTMMEKDNKGTKQ
tara:strand:+ start:1776 stop:2048 length:273 start_codon:yes stop_codon:yes gene_type:complete